MDSRVTHTLNKVLHKFEPPQIITLSEYAEQNCYLPSEAGGLPGPYRLSVTPFHKEILDSITDKRYDKVTWLAGSQLGKTLCLLIASHYFMVEEPSPILLLEPNKELSSALSDQRFRPYIRDNKKLKNLLTDKESKDNISEKQFPGGYLVFGSSQTLTDVISRPIRILMLDEVSSYPFNLKEKGNPISLAIARTASSFRDSRKIITASTPGIEGLCNVTEAYSKSDQRVYLVPCPFCSEYVEFGLQAEPGKDIATLEWPKDSEGVGAYALCPHCKGHILDSHKQWMLSNGYWKITKPEIKDHAGFKLNGFYSPFITFEDIAVRYRAAKVKAGKMYNDSADLIEFYNQTLAMTWNDQHLSHIGKHDILARTEYYQAEVPAGVGLILAGVDIQRDRIEVTVLGFGKLNQIYLINHFVIFGDTSIDPDLQNAIIWKELDILLNRPFKHQTGKDIYIRNAFIDAGDGVTTQQVRKYCLQRTNRGIFAIKGSRIPTDPIFPGKKFKDPKTGKYIGFELGVNLTKDDIHHRLQITLPDGGGYIHFPKYSNIDDEYFKQLTSESVVNKQNNKGILQRVWEKKYKSIRNEALDCFGYALACKHFFISDKEPDIIDKLVDILNTLDTVEEDIKEEEELDQPITPINKHSITPNPTLNNTPRFIRPIRKW